MSYSSKIDLLSEYIDTVNHGQKTNHTHENKEWLELFQTVDRIKLVDSIEMPSNDFVEKVAKKIRSVERKQKSIKKNVRTFGGQRWWLVAASVLLVIGLLWQQFSTSIVSANQITVIKEKKLMQLGPQKIETPSFISSESVISFGDEEKIWIWDPQTNKKEALPLGSFQYMRNPSWSPDGTRVAFSGYKNGTAGIWIMNKDGSGVNKVITPTSLNENDDTPVWSPDGKQIAFTKTATKAKPSHGFSITKQEIWSISPDGTDAKKVVNGKDPSWSPDGKQLSFTKPLLTEQGSEEVWIINSNGSNAKRLTNGMESSWSPDGQFIVYSMYNTRKDKFTKMATVQTSFREIWAIHVTSHKRSQLTKGKIDKQQVALWKQESKKYHSKIPIQYVSSGQFGDWLPSWSKDGKSIIFARDTQQENANHFSLYKIDLQFD
jgi:TolB protein